MTDHRLSWLEQPGASALLLRLLDRDEFITRLLRSAVNPDGVATQDGLRTLRNLLGSERGVGLIDEEERKGAGPRPRLYVFLTPLGRRVAEMLKQVADALAEKAQS
ncbi:MAG: hypothetical protein ACE5H4_07420 [Candidatus Thorarchaeota archaeon]